MKTSFPSAPDCGPAHGWVRPTRCENRRPRHSRHAPPPPRPRPARWMRRGDDRGDEGHSPGIPEPSTEAAWSPAPRSRHASPGPFHETGRASSLLRRLPLGCFCQRTSLPTGHPVPSETHLHLLSSIPTPRSSPSWNLSRPAAARWLAGRGSALLPGRQGGGDLLCSPLWLPTLRKRSVTFSSTLT